MCEQNTLSKLYGNLPQTSSLWNRDARGTTRSARDPSGASGLRTRPQDDIVSSCRGCRPCTPLCKCKHTFLNFDYPFYHPAPRRLAPRGRVKQVIRLQDRPRARAKEQLPFRDHRRKEIRSRFHSPLFLYSSYSSLVIRLGISLFAFAKS